MKNNYKYMHKKWQRSVQYGFCKDKRLLYMVLRASALYVAH